MNIEVIRDGNKSILKVKSSSLKRAEALELKKEALKLILAGRDNLALDLSRTEEIDSSGIGKLLFLNRKLSNLKGEFSIDRIHRVLYTYLDSLALNKVIKIHPPV